VPRALVVIKEFRVDAQSVIADSQPKVSLVVPEFNFDLARACVAEGIT
jgi:hypothetical protein